PEIHPRKRTHVVNVVDNLYKIITGHYDGLYEALSERDRQGVSREMYEKTLDEIKALYDGLPDWEKRLLPVVADFHDIGSREGERDWTHHQLGARLAGDVLKRFPGLSRADAAFVQQMIYLHGGIVNVGIDFFPEEILSLPQEQQDMLSLFSLIDMSGRQDGRNALSLDVLKTFREKHTKINPTLMDKETFVEYRIGKTFSPFVMTEEEQKKRVAGVKQYFERDGFHWDGEFVRNFSRVRINVFDIFNRLSKRSSDIYAELLAQISRRISQEEQGRDAFVDIVVDADVDYMGLPFGPEASARDEYISAIERRLKQQQPVLFKSEVKDKTLYLTFQLEEMKRQDAAMLASEAQAPGGIDMNEIDVKRKGKGIVIPIDPAQLEMMLEGGVDGFAPIIIDVTPLNSVLPLLGLGSELDPAEKREELEMVSSI
ncbi:MAG TPA: hypothetical protein VLJ10_01540, partial [Candidatus Bathyarchaeia archaeon]|nr:hypothetical protein [Candidatus Bathyarchaeia archaeon]